ncbi:C-terminal domain-containing protein [Melanogaster broomeanus]|nr:C-terminal domain-containing protein [Melanogaster broomeanus]
MQVLRPKGQLTKTPTSDSSLAQRVQYLEKSLAKYKAADTRLQNALDAMDSDHATGGVSLTRKELSRWSNIKPRRKKQPKHLELAPALTVLVNCTGHHPTLVFYDTNTTIVPTLQRLLEATTESEELLSTIPEFRYHLVYVTRQLLPTSSSSSYESLLRHYNSPPSNASAVEEAGKPLLQLLYDLDDLLLTDSNFLLANWINAAKSWSNGNATYSAILGINDYASKQWAGLVAGYYAPRWEAFVQYLVDTKQNGAPYNATVVLDMMIAIGEKWTTRLGFCRSGKWGLLEDRKSASVEV